MIEVPGEEHLIGQGLERKIYRDPQHPDRVVGVQRENIKTTPRQTKGRYYLTKLLHILNPLNIPDIHLAVAEPDLVVRDLVDLDENNRRFQELRLILEKREKIPQKLEEDVTSAMLVVKEDPRVKALVAQLKKFLNEGLDDSGHNFSFDEQGNVQYLETPLPWDLSPGFEPKCYFNEQELRKAIENIDDETKKRFATTCLNNLIRLWNEDLEEIKK